MNEKAFGGDEGERSLHVSGVDPELRDSSRVDVTDFAFLETVLEYGDMKVRCSELNVRHVGKTLRLSCLNGGDFGGRLSRTS